MKWVSSRTSAGEKFSSSRHFGIRAWIWSANLVASPRCSRCARCCRVSAMARANYALAPPLATLADRRRQFIQELDRIIPAKARIRDALSERERLARPEVLAPLDEVRLDHQADDAPLAAADLPG